MSKRGKRLPRPHPNPPKQGLFRVAIEHAWAILVGVSVIVGLVVAYFALRPDISVAPYVQLDPDNPFSMQFTITNNGLLMLHDVYPYCGITSVEMTGHSRINGGGTGGVQAPIAELRSKGTTTANCRIHMSNSLIVEAKVDIIVNFRPDWWPRRTAIHFPFSGTKDSQGHVIWLHQAG
jgi:hypothetical protein